MRIALLYPPPWKIPAPGQTPDDSRDGPPSWDPQAFDTDYLTIPYGLLSLAAQAMRAGHDVRTFNLSNFAWADVEGLIAGLEADLFGLSCFTANRRGVVLTADCIRGLRPAAHITIGGPHASALPREMLEHHPAIDTVVIGEGEATFMEMVARLAAGGPATGLAGTAWREGHEVAIGPPRQRIRELDGLANLHDHFCCYVLLTSRGCPGRCTYCGSNAMWGNRLCFHSVGYVLDTLEKMLRRLPVKMIAIKDDTFTANRKRALEICRGIVQRKLNFLWSCDTRADAVDEELLEAMRLAGCQRLSLGVESASPEILRNVRKRLTPEGVMAATRMMQKLGFEIRYYMMAGNRGETRETFRQSLDFVAAAQPDLCMFHVLSIYPGTEEFEILKRSGRGSNEQFFTNDLQGLAMFPDTPPDQARDICNWVAAHRGRHRVREKTVQECEAALELLGELHLAHMDLGAAHFRASEGAAAERHIRRALELGYPAPELAHNYLACLAAARGEIAGAQAQLRQAMQGTPRRIVAGNMNSLNAWVAAGGVKTCLPLRMTAYHNFDIPVQLCQPVMPGPIGREQMQIAAGGEVRG